MNFLDKSHSCIKMLPRHERKPSLVGFTSDSILLGNVKYRGDGFIAGTGKGVVTVDGQPSSRRVYLFEQSSMACLSDMWSNDNGEYRFINLSDKFRYMVLARDYTGKYSPISVDNVIPKK